MFQETLNLIEIFRSVQGETSFSGLPTTFVRTAACNLRCTWCDSTYSFGRGEPWTLERILEEVESAGCKYVCVTGGEPLLQKNVHLLMKELCDRGYIVSLETGGSLPTKDVDQRVYVILDIKCPDSGMSDKNDWKNLEWLRKHDEVKFVINGHDDYLWAKDVCHKFSLFDREKPVLFSPVHGVLDPKELLSWTLEDKIPFRLNLQIHKFIWSPETQGV